MLLTEELSLWPSLCFLKTIVIIYVYVCVCIPQVCKCLRKTGKVLSPWSWRDTGNCECWRWVLGAVLGSSGSGTRAFKQGATSPVPYEWFLKPALLWVCRVSRASLCLRMKNTLAVGSSTTVKELSYHSRTILDSPSLPLAFLPSLLSMTHKFCTYIMAQWFS